MLADFLSNFIQHPSQKMDYGIFNKAIGRSMDQAWWGTRTQHIVGVAATLTITDYASQSIFAKSLGRPLCFAKSPATFVAHTFLFIFTGVTLYVGLDAGFNPTLQGRRLEAFKEGTYCSYVGSNTAWFEPYVPVAVARCAGVAAGSSWIGGALLPATLAYSTVKGVGWTDFGNQGLNDHEMRLNGLSSKQ
jgi:hypothetical protein